MQNTRIDEPVHSLLKLALLAENGGIMLEEGCYFPNGFSFLEEMFTPKADALDHLTCSP